MTVCVSIFSNTTNTLALCAHIIQIRECLQFRVGGKLERVFALSGLRARREWWHRQPAEVSILQWLFHWWPTIFTATFNIANSKFHPSTAITQVKQSSQRVAECLFTLPPTFNFVAAKSEGEKDRSSLAPLPMLRSSNTLGVLIDDTIRSSGEPSSERVSQVDTFSFWFIFFQFHCHTGNGKHLRFEH